MMEDLEVHEILGVSETQSLHKHLLRLLVPASTVMDEASRVTSGPLENNIVTSSRMRNAPYQEVAWKTNPYLQQPIMVHRLFTTRFGITNSIHFLMHTIH